MAVCLVLGGVVGLVSGIPTHLATSGGATGAAALAVGATADGL
ncbi:hypothetical protein SAMN04488691_10958 [Haloferax larsenii]|nr:hypothetical protein SAMN04488691_10958 [Haloferax larsenii]